MTNKSILNIVIWIVLMFLTGCVSDTPDSGETSSKSTKVDKTRQITPITSTVQHYTRLSIFEYQGHRYIVVGDGGVAHTVDCIEQDIKTARKYEN